MTLTAPTLIRETFPVGPLQCNCTIIGDPISKKAIVVDHAPAFVQMSEELRRAGHVAHLAQRAQDGGRVAGHARSLPDWIRWSLNCTSVVARRCTDCRATNSRLPMPCVTQPRIRREAPA